MNFQLHDKVVCIDDTAQFETGGLRLQEGTTYAVQWSASVDGVPHVGLVGDPVDIGWDSSRFRLAHRCPASFDLMTLAELEKFLDQLKRDGLIK
jgi:hypothetical protein